MINKDIIIQKHLDTFITKSGDLYQMQVNTGKLRSSATIHLVLSLMGDSLKTLYDITYSKKLVHTLYEEIKTHILTGPLHSNVTEKIIESYYNRNVLSHIKLNSRTAILLQWCKSNWDKVLTLLLALLTLT